MGGVKNSGGQWMAAAMVIAMATIIKRASLSRRATHRVVTIRRDGQRDFASPEAPGRGGMNAGAFSPIRQAAARSISHSAEHLAHRGAAKTFVLIRAGLVKGRFNAVLRAGDKVDSAAALDAYLAGRRRHNTATRA